MYRVALPKREFHLIQEHELSKEEDAPMSIAVNPSVSTVPRHILQPLARVTRERQADPPGA